MSSIRPVRNEEKPTSTCPFHLDQPVPKVNSLFPQETAGSPKTEEEKTAILALAPKASARNHGFFSCCFSDPEEIKHQEEILKDEIFYRSRIDMIAKENETISKTPKYYRMMIIGKVTSSFGDSQLVFVGDDIAKKMGFKKSDLLGKDISFLFINPDFAVEHKGFLAGFTGAGSILKRVEEVSRLMKLDSNQSEISNLICGLDGYDRTSTAQAPTGERHFMLKAGKKDMMVQAKFKLFNFLLTSQNTMKEPDKRKYYGPHTLAFFESVSRPIKSMTNVTTVKESKTNSLR